MIRCATQLSMVRELTPRRTASGFFFSRGDGGLGVGFIQGFACQSVDVQVLGVMPNHWSAASLVTNSR
jgi:hypothetical protein